MKFQADELTITDHLRTKVIRARRWAKNPLAILARTRRGNDERAQETHDTRGGHPSRTIIIASEMRTGSTLLCEGLAATNEVGRPYEYFSPALTVDFSLERGVPEIGVRSRLAMIGERVRLRRHWHGTWDIETSEMVRYLRLLLQHRTSRDGTFSVNIQWKQMKEMLGRHDFDQSWLPEPITWVHLWREDVVAQGVSAAKAMQAWEWQSGSNSSRWREELFYEDSEVSRYVAVAIDSRQAWDDYFREHNIVPIQITYEQLTTDYNGTMRRLFDDLGLADVDVPDAQIPRQADALNVEWVRRFRAQHPEFLLPQDER